MFIDPNVSPDSFVLIFPLGSKEFLSSEGRIRGGIFALFSSPSKGRKQEPGKAKSWTKNPFVRLVFF